MKKLFIIANWKSNKDTSEAKSWLQEFQISNFKFQISNKEIIVCPPFTLLSFFKSYILNHKSQIKLGAQDISPFNTGAYTGEISGQQIKEFADYVLIGHSERRKYFGEDEEAISKKIKQAIDNNLIPIICISDVEQIKNLKFKIQSSNSKFKILISYEPLFAVGSGYADTPEDAQKIALKIKKELGDIPVLYGGSVNAENVKSFTEIPEISGVLVGQESLEAQEFLKIIFNA